MIYKPCTHSALYTLSMVTDTWPFEIVVHSKFVRFLMSQPGKHVGDTFVGKNHVRHITDNRRTKQGL